MLKRKVEKSKMTQQQFLIRCINDKAINVIDINIMKDIVRELNAIGNNLNQIAKIANTQKHTRNITINEIQKTREGVNNVWLQLKQLKQG